jgi:hypothetical protein
LKHTTGYNLLDHRRNEGIMEGLKVDPLEKKLTQYKEKWLYNVSKMEDIRHPKQLLYY